jgi:hypothetical protein
VNGDEETFMVRIRSVEINQFIQAEQHMGEAFEAIGMGLQKALRDLLLGAMKREPSKTPGGPARVAQGPPG